MVDLRILTIEDIGQVLELSLGENWNQTEKDWELLIRNPGNVCLAIEKGGRILGTATAMNYNNDIAWIGMVLVHPEYRGRGWSTLLLSRLFDRLDTRMSVKLDATPAGQPVYQKFGFRGEYLIHRMIAESLSVKSLQVENKSLPMPLIPVDIPRIIEYDGQVFGTGRKRLLEFLLKENPEKAWIIKQNGQIAGFVMGRIGSQFHQVGPVMASTDENAKKLILKSLSEMGGADVVLDVLDDKKDLMSWLIAVGFKKQRHFIRMYRQENTYQGMPGNHYTICGPEFG